ncbi:hypothetical protein RHSIM_Rhsim12G0162300 [Rhododendron simsii]|uniref:Uncharacterized protein n=1 Tax=Rhododendron simsii TaxID=118357 RepID=A0A834G4F8_RHOSS|nr:hypothetical protein RHSIM_Rhsim12G0162300 [Rhododendron simsii]
MAFLLNKTTILSNLRSHSQVLSSVSLSLCCNSLSLSSRIFYRELNRRLTTRSRDVDSMSSQGLARKLMRAVFNQARYLQLLAEDPSLKRFKSHKKSVWRLKRIGDVLTIVVVAGCCYEIYVKAVMREEARKQASGSA